MKESIAVATALTMLAGLVVGAEKPSAWSQFRGPNGSGVADGQKPPIEFGPDKNVKWKVAVPGGLSSPIVAGDLLVLTAFDDGKLWTIAYNRADGKESWRKEAKAKAIEKFMKVEGSPAASTPTTDGERIVSYFGSCGLVCYDLKGKELWTYEMPPAVIGGNFGSGVSPILVDGIVVLVRDETKNARIVAVDVLTGKPRWEKKRQSPASYCTPVVWDAPKGKQIVAAGHGRMVGYDLKTGDEKWFVSGMPTGCCTSPVVADGSLLFAGWSPGGPDDMEFKMPTFDALLKDLDADKDGTVSRDEAAKSFLKDFFDSNDGDGDGKISRAEWDGLLKFMNEGRNSAFALKAGASGDATRSHTIWKKTKGLPYIATAIAYRGQYLMVKDGGIVTALEAATGKEIASERAAEPGRYYASPVAANGHVYFTCLDGGAVTVLKVGEGKPEVKAKNPKLGERSATTPAIADDAIYIRTEKHLYAFSEKK